MAHVLPIFLIGPMGSGKSTVGAALAQRLGAVFHDSDQHVESRSGTTIPQLFDTVGEAGFRDAEERAIDALTREPAIVLATGGGAVLRQGNRQHLAERGTTIYLEASVSAQLARTQGSDRPLLRTPDPTARLTSLLAERDPLYRATAHYVVATDDSSAESVVESILQRTGARVI